MNRRDFLKRSTLATAGVLVGAEVIHDFLAWQNRRIFALGGLPKDIYTATHPMWHIDPSDVSNSFLSHHDVLRIANEIQRLVAMSRLST